MHVLRAPTGMLTAEDTSAHSFLSLPQTGTLPYSATHVIIPISTRRISHVCGPPATHLCPPHLQQCLSTMGTQFTCTHASTQQLPAAPLGHTPWVPLSSPPSTSHPHQNLLSEMTTSLLTLLRVNQDCLQQNYKRGGTLSLATRQKAQEATQLVTASLPLVKYISLCH